MGKPHHLLRSVLEFPWEGLSDVVIVIIGLKKWKLSHGSAVWKSEIKVWIGHAPSETCGGILSGLFLVWGGEIVCCDSQGDQFPYKSEEALAWRISGASTSL